MKRNMDLVRNILFQAEATEAGKAIIPVLPGHNKDEIGRHVELMRDGGLIEAVLTPSGDRVAHRIIGYRIQSITPEGYDFLEAARNDGIWKKAKRKCLKAPGGLAIDVLKQCLIDVAMQAVGLNETRPR